MSAPENVRVVVMSGGFVAVMNTEKIERRLDSLPCSECGQLRDTWTEYSRRTWKVYPMADAERLGYVLAPSDPGEPKP